MLKSNDQQSSQKIIDTHCHLWDLSLGYHAWLTKQQESHFLGDLRTIQQNYLLENYLEDTQQFTIKKMVHIEATSSSFALDEVNWLQRHYERSELLGAIIAGVDLLSPKLEALLEAYSSIKKIKGVRE